MTNRPSIARSPGNEPMGNRPLGYFVAGKLEQAAVSQARLALTEARYQRRAQARSACGALLCSF